MKFTKSIAAKLFVAVLAGAAVGSTGRADQLPPYPAQQPTYPADDAAAQMRSNQNALDQDRQTLTAEQNSLASLRADREREAQHVNDLQRQASAPIPPAPAPAPSAVPSSPADQTALRQQLDAAKSAADDAHDQALAKFEQTDAWVKAKDEFEHARQDLQGPTDSVLDRLGQSQDYQNLVSTAHSAKENLDKVQGDSHADPKAVQQAQDAFTAADNQVQSTEEKSLEADPTVTARRKIVDAARTKLDALRDGFEQNLVSDPSFAPLAAKVDGLQQALASANGTTAPAPQASTPPPPAVDPHILQQEQAKLDQMNRDVDQLQQDVDRLSQRVQQEQDALADAQRGYDASQNGYANGPTPPPPGDSYPQPYGQPAYAAPTYPYAAPAYGYVAPAYAYAAPVYAPTYSSYYPGYNCYGYGGVYLSYGYGGPSYYGGYYHSNGYPHSYGYGNGYSGRGYHSGYGTVHSYASVRGRTYAAPNYSTYSSRSYGRAYSGYTGRSTYSSYGRGGYAGGVRSSPHAIERSSYSSGIARSFEARPSESRSSHGSEHSGYSSRDHSH